MASFILPKKPQILYAPMLSTFGGGSARGFGGPGSGGGFPEFILTLTNGTSYSVNYDSGDSDSTINSFFTTNLASDPGYISSSGTSLYKPFTGYYSMQLAIDAEVNIRCKGASGGLQYNNSWNRALGYGRDVDGTFSLNANDILVFGVGKTGQPDVGADSNSGGTGGGATFCYKRVSSTDTILVIGAGGSGSPVYQSWNNDSFTRGDRRGSSAVPLTAKGTGQDATTRSVRNNYSSPNGWSYSTANSGGFGRADAGGGGGGYNNRGYLIDASSNANNGNGLLGSNGNYNGGYGSGYSNAKRGGWGGGAGQVSGNGYAAGGGGYFGGTEVGNSSTTSGMQYSFYAGNTESRSDYMGPRSYVENNASSWTDNGIFGTPSTNSDDTQKGGEIVFTFNPA